MDLLEFVMNNSYLSFDDLVFHQVDGTAMGTAMRAHLRQHRRLHAGEDRAGRHAQQSVLHLYRRFLDDVFAFIERSARRRNSCTRMNHCTRSCASTSSARPTEAAFLDLRIHKGAASRATGVFDLACIRRR